MKTLKGLTRTLKLGIPVTTLVAILLTTGITVISGAVETGAPVEEFTAHLNRRIPRLMDRYDIPGVTIALVQKGKTVWAEAYGHADTATERKMTVDTPCRGESISKPITAWAINQDYLALKSFTTSEPYPAKK